MGPPRASFIRVSGIQHATQMTVCNLASPHFVVFLRLIFARLVRCEYEFESELSRARVTTCLKNEEALVDQGKQRRSTVGA
jgi:hypothetical protein